MGSFVILEYPEPVSPGNRRVFDPVGDGPLIFEATQDEASALQTRLGAPSPFRVVAIEYARKAKLLPSDDENGQGT